MNEPQTSAPAGLVDSFGRLHDNLRVSVTDRCNLRCLYCMPDNPVFQPKEELLTFEEIERVVRVAAGLGIRKIRLTGGEPLARRDLPTLVEKIVPIPGIVDVGMTTNGVFLDKLAAPLWDAGLRRINVSLDSMRRETFQRLTRRDELHRVLAGIDAARSAGFQKIKINAVAMRGAIEDELADFARFAREGDMEIRFIEYMPLNTQHEWRRDSVLAASEILETIGRTYPLVADPQGDPHAPAEKFFFADGAPGAIGIIASVTQPFCDQCNRMRLTADGKVRNCLFALDELDVRALLRGEGTDEQIAEVFCRSVAAKWRGHQINMAGFVQPERAMHSIGG